MNPLRIPGSRDPGTAEVYVPPRRYAADGSLRECEPVLVDAVGTLASWTVHEDEHYGLVDLSDGVRLQALLDPGTHRIGDSYLGVHDPAGNVRFRRA